MTDYNIIWTDNTSTVHQEPDPVQPRSTLQNILRGIVALLFVLAMLYLYGGQQFIQFHETPEGANAGTYESVIDAETATVPVTVFVLTGDTENNEDRSRQLITQADKILDQASVDLSPVEVQFVQIPSDSQPGPELVNDPTALKRLLPELQDDRLNVVLVEALGGINGIAFSGRRAVAVAEYTTTFDFRVLAHEIGHALSLQHVSDRSNLMNSGGSGTTLLPEQAQAAHEAARTFSSQGS